MYAVFKSFLQLQIILVCLRTQALFPPPGLFTPKYSVNSHFETGFFKNHLKADVVDQSSLDPHDFLVHLYDVGQVII